MPTSSLSPRHFYAMAALAGTTLFAQVALTRLFSVVQYYHGAFFAISLALFGFSVSGVYVYVRSEAFTGERLDGAIARYAILFAAAIPGCFYFYLYLGVGRVLVGAGIPAPSGLVAGLEYLLLAVPFFASGACISLLLQHGASEANRLYATDLAASAAGAVLVVPALAVFGGPKTMLVASVVAASGAWVMAHERPRLRRAAAGIAITALSVAGFVPAGAFNAMKLRKPPLVVAKQEIRWNAFSMVGVGDEKRPASRLPDGTPIEYHTRDIVIDNSVSTAMIQSDGDLSKLSFLELDWNSGAHILRPNGRALIIGAGGGRDIQVARVHGQREIWALEVNPLVVETTDEVYGDYTGRPYSAPSVHAVVGDARSYIANSDRRYDVILASLIDTWAASAAGAFALTENLLYTRDAFLDYYEHLEDDGVLSIARWHPLNSARLLGTGLDAWRIAGVKDPRQHAFVALSTREPGIGLRIVILLMKKSPFSDAEIAKLESFAERAGLTPVVTPHTVKDPLLAEYLEARARGVEPWPGIDTMPATDDRPFFFNSVRPSAHIKNMLGLGELYEFSGGFRANLTATRDLIQLLIAVAIMLGLMILLPLQMRATTVSGPRLRSVLGYFICLGLGYIFIEIALVQRLILLLGKPVYSLSVILSSMLLSSGFGSWVSRRLTDERIAARLPWFLIGAGTILLAYAWGLPAAIDALLGAAFPARLVAAVGFVAVPAFLLGMPFPSGLRALGDRYGNAIIPWVWGVNGAMSVLASVASIIIAIEYGYTVVFLVGAACYFGAALFLTRWTRPQAVPAAAGSSAGIRG